MSSAAVAPRADNVGDDPLAQVRVGYADHGGFRDGGVVKQARFDLGGPDQVAAGLDEVGGLAADDPMQAVGAKGGNVARSEPAVMGPAFGAGCWLVQVAVEQGVATDLQVTEGVPVARHRQAMIVHDPAVHPGDRCAHPARPARLVSPGGERDQCFRHPVALDGNLAGQGGDVTGHSGRQRGTARDEQPGATERSRVCRGRGNARPHRRHTEEHAPAAAFGCRRIPLGARPFGMDQRASQVERAEHPEDQPMHMEQRQAMHHYIAGRPGPRVREAVEARPHRAPGQQHTLGSAGRP